MPRDDAMAVRAYLNTLQPIASTRPDNKLTWPLNYRVFMSGWNRLFFTPGTFTPDPRAARNGIAAPIWSKDPAIAAPATPPRTRSAATIEELRGGQLQDWFVPNISNDFPQRIGRWSADEIAEYLKTGRNAKSGASALMSEVVTHSTAKMSDADLQAIATYLKSMPGSAERQAVAAPDRAVMDAGKAIYLDSCSACHRSDGEGAPGTFPALKGNATAQGRDPTTIIRVILDGTRAVPTNARPTPLSMPSFKWKLSDEQIAALASYVRSAWGNAAPAVSSSDVRSLRQLVGASESNR